MLDTRNDLPLGIRTPVVKLLRGRCAHAIARHGLSHRPTAVAADHKADRHRRSPEAHLHGQR